MVLTQVLHRLHMRALAESPQPVRTDLSGGLRITLQLAHGRTYISIARRASVPSMTEFDTIMRHYPNGKPTQLNPVLLPTPQEDGFYHLTANWENSDAIELDKIPTQLQFAI